MYFIYLFIYLFFFLKLRYFTRPDSVCQKAQKTFRLDVTRTCMCDASGREKKDVEDVEISTAVLILLNARSKGTNRQ